LRLPGYTEEEKIEIATRFLVTKQLEANGLKNKSVSFAADALQEILRRYTREAGVRNLEREIASICRKIARKLVKEGQGTAVQVTAQSIPDYLGVPKFRPRTREGKNEVGIATGLAWTEVGGELLVTEASLMYGKGGLTLTGKLGEVMQESAQTALSFIRSRAEELGIARDFNRRIDVHIHVPEGAIPKDGPSAGITMCTALVSALTNISVRSDVAMTGEITLRGKILPIGGVKEKLLAAHRAGITHIILPRDNEKDLADIPENVLNAMNIKMVETMDEVFESALTAPVPKNAEPEEESAAPQGLDEGIQGESIAH